MKGFLFIDKEKGMTSFDLVRKVRKISGVKKVGHSGTLDPLATGLLIIAIGEGTKLLEFLIGMDKDYEVVAKFGFVSDTYDAEGAVTEVDSEKVVERSELERVVSQRFLGDIKQVPPIYSALKVDGKKAYELARKGEKVELKERDVRIDAFDILDFDWPIVKFKVSCGSGTYIRSLIHDLGQVLGVGAYVEELRRTTVGDFRLDKAVKLDVLDKNIDQHLASLEEIAKNFDYWDLKASELEGLKDGRTLLNKKIEHDRPLMAFYNDKLVGVLENSGAGVKYKKMIF